jgi:CBS-domain-containing membrane protein
MQKIFKYHTLVIKRKIVFNYSKWIFSFIGSFASISIIFTFHRWIGNYTHQDTVMLIGSLGASAVIMFGTPHSLFALPRNLIGGHIISAIIGVTLYKMMNCPECIWVSSALAVSLSLVIMQISRTIHPPAGATALIAIIGTNKIHSLGYTYIISPVFSGALILLGVHLLMKYILVNFKINKSKL